MPFIPHTSEDTRAMLEYLGISSIDRLFDEIPSNIRAGDLKRLPDGVSEMELLQSMEERANQDDGYQCFIGAGAYEHYIPAAVWDIVSRGEFLTAYTPYQAEASQGTLQLIYEFQTMMSHLTGMDVSNASVYDGASALAEAVLMAVRGNRKSKSRRVLCAGNLHPSYKSACQSIVRNQEIELIDLPWDEVKGTLEPLAMESYEGQDLAALIVSNPSFFGTLEDVHALTDWAHSQNLLVIAVVNPTSLALLRPPGKWGTGPDQGADIVVGEGQPLGIPLASGGPYLGFMCCKQSLVRQMPGRIIGRTEDVEGATGFALTLQAREQHIRRAKATSNICTNQGLLVTAATIYMSLMGAEGLKSIAHRCHLGLRHLVEAISTIPGVSERFDAPCFHEAVIHLPVNAGAVLKAMEEEAILGGFDLSETFAPLSDCILVNVTETKTLSDLDAYKNSLHRAIERVKNQ